MDSDQFVGTGRNFFLGGDFTNCKGDSGEHDNGLEPLFADG